MKGCQEYFTFLFLSVLLLTYISFFSSFAVQHFTCARAPHLLYRSYPPVIARILLGNCNCLPGGFFSVGTFLNLSVSLHGLKAWTWLLGNSIACGVVMTTCCEGSQQGWVLWSYWVCQLGTFHKIWKQWIITVFPVADVDVAVCELFASSAHSTAPLLLMVLVCSSPVRTSSPVPLWVPPLSPAEADCDHLKGSKNQY